MSPNTQVNAYPVAFSSDPVFEKSPLTTAPIISLDFVNKLGLY